MSRRLREIYYQRQRFSKDTRLYALKAKQKELKRQGKGNKPKVIAALSDEEIDILCSKKVLGLSSPQALVTLFC